MQAASRSPFMPQKAKTISHTILRLLRDRAPQATLCPSEVARALAPEAWRALMQPVRTVAVDMARQGLITIRQKGHAVSPDAPLRGPIRLGHTAADTAGHPTTPDGRYFVVRGRLWRKSNPDLPPEEQQALVAQLMDARRALRATRSAEERAAARAQVDRVKRALGERGPVWWDDGAPDMNRKMAKNTPYQAWFDGLDA